MVKCMGWLRLAIIGTTNQCAFSSVVVLLTSISLPRAGRGQSSMSGDRAVRRAFCQWARGLRMVLPTFEFMGRALRILSWCPQFHIHIHVMSKSSWSLKYWTENSSFSSSLGVSETSSRPCPFFRQRPALHRIELLSVFRIFKVCLECHSKYNWLGFKAWRWEVKCTKCDVNLGHNCKLYFLACLHSLQILFYFLSLLSAINKWTAERTAKQLRELSR